MAGNIPFFRPPEVGEPKSGLKKKTEEILLLLVVMGMPFPSQH